ncbi:hypothetical protein ACM66B_007016 [Microbotryomycetes sp. NB124-2]
MSGHPFTFPNNNPRDSSQDEVIMGTVEPSSHEQTLARFRASVATLSQQQQQSRDSSTSNVPQTPIQPPPPLPTTASHPVAASPTPSIVRHHLPSRPLTTPVPVANAPTYPVPIDNFAAPRSDSQQTYVTPTAIMSGHRQQDSLGTIDEKFGLGAGASTTHVAMYDDDVSLLSNRDNRFTLGDYMDGSGKESGRRTKTPTGGRQGWDDAAQGRKKKWVRVLVAIFVVLAIILAVALGVGLTRKSHDDKAESTAPAAESGSSSSSSASRVPSSILPTSTPSRSSSSSSAARTSAQTSSPTRSASPTRTRSSSADDTAETFSTSFAFEENGATTVVPLTYTIPQSRLTRENGWYQFTQDVELPHATGGGSFTSELRFRVKPTGEAESEATRVRRRDRVKRAMRERVIR